MNSITVVHPSSPSESSDKVALLDLRGAPSDSEVCCHHSDVAPACRHPLATTLPARLQRPGSWGIFHHLSADFPETHKAEILPIGKKWCEERCRTFQGQERARQCLPEMGQHTGQGGPQTPTEVLRKSRPGAQV